MGQAIGFAVILVVLGIFLPSVLHAFEEFLLVLLGRATQLVESIELPTTQPAAVIQTMQY